LGLPPWRSLVYNAFSSSNFEIACQCKAFDMPLTLSLKQTSSVPLEVEGILPESVRGKSLAEVEQMKMFQGNNETPLAEFFKITGDPDDGVMIFDGDVQGVHWIGCQMSEGRIEVRGNAGRHVGSEMTGGRIDVAGDVSDWVGGEMKGGLIHVKGRAGHLAGAAYRGSASGMTGGTLLIEGDAGNEIGHTMRRGMLVVGGSIGDLAGFNMLAGNIFVGGESGIRHGAGMRRGTLTFWGDAHPPLLPTFRRACRFRPHIFQIVFRDLLRLGFPLAESLLQADFDLYHGDFLEGGKGEILLRAS